MKKLPASPNHLSLLYGEERGWLIDHCERQAGYRKFDYLGFADLIAIYDRGIALIQATSSAHRANRISRVTTKVKELAKEGKLRYILTKGSIEVWTWRVEADGDLYLRKFKFIRSRHFRNSWTNYEPKKERVKLYS